MKQRPILNLKAREERARRARRLSPRRGCLGCSSRRRSAERGGSVARSWYQSCSKGMNPRGREAARPACSSAQAALPARRWGQATMGQGKQQKRGGSTGIGPTQGGQQGLSAHLQVRGGRWLLNTPNVPEVARTAHPPSHSQPSPFSFPPCLPPPSLPCAPPSYP